MREHFPELKAALIPVLVSPDGSYHNDSTPMILALEEQIAVRRVVPAAPAVAFVAALLEDFADEWMTKIM